jgi:spore germination protein KB
MTEISPVIIIIVFIIICIYIISRGLEVIARFIELSGPIIIVSLITFTVLGSNNIDLTILLPIYKDSTFLSINRGAIEFSLLTTDMYILVMNAPQLENKKDFKKIIIKSTVYSLLIILMMVIVTQTSLGIEQAKHSNYPFLAYVRMVRTYSIFERIESAFLVTWTVTIMSKIVAYIYISSYAFKEIFKRKNANLFIYPIAIISAAITYYLAEINPMTGDIHYLSSVDLIYYSIFKIGIPTIAIIIYFFRRKSFEKQEKLSE